MNEGTDSNCGTWAEQNAVYAWAEKYRGTTIDPEDRPKFHELAEATTKFRLQVQKERDALQNMLKDEGRKVQRLTESLAEEKEEAGTYYARHRIASDERDESYEKVEQMRTAIKDFLIEWAWMDGPEGWRESCERLRANIVDPVAAEVDPTEDHGYQEFVDGAAKDCTADDKPCDACLAGGVCDGPSLQEGGGA